MDPLTHGIAGALIAKAFFVRGAVEPPAAATPDDSRGASKAKEAARVTNLESRITVLVVTLGAVVPDADFVFNLMTSSRVATLEYHRWITHSLVCLPLFALVLGAVTWWWLGRRNGAQQAAPLRLAWMYAAGIASHILLDVVTSWGTQVWAPLSRERVNWDSVFILDGVLTAILLLPLIAAWLPHQPKLALARGMRFWVALSLAFAGLRMLATAIGADFSWVLVVVGSAVLGGFLLLTVRQSRMRADADSSRVEPLPVVERRWCRAGVVAAALYLSLCAVAHDRALARVRQAVATQGIAAENVGALPLPPFATRWGGLVRTRDGVHLALFNLLEDAPLQFEFTADNAPPDLLARARQLPEVQTYFWFARFPVMRLVERNGRRALAFNDLRFVRRWSSAPALFEYWVIFDPTGNVTDHGWAPLAETKEAALLKEK